MKSLEDLLASLATLDGPDTLEAQRSLRRVQAGFKRLREDPREAQRISDIADLVEAARDAYDLGELAQARGDLEAAERYFRRAADADFDDAAYRLAQVLELRGAVSPTPAAEVDAALLRDATAWYERAHDAGIPGAAARLADLLAQRGQSLEAARYYEKARQDELPEPKIEDHPADDESISVDFTAEPVGINVMDSDTYSRFAEHVAFLRQALMDRHTQHLELLTESLTRNLLGTSAWRPPSMLPFDTGLAERIVKHCLPFEELTAAQKLLLHTSRFRDPVLWRPTGHRLALTVWHRALAPRQASRILVAIDIEGFGRPELDDRARMHLRRALLEVVENVLHSGGISPNCWTISTTGDGLLIVADPKFATEQLVQTLLDRLPVELDRHNRLALPHAQLRIRVGMHTAEVTLDRYGVASEGVNLVFRLLDGDMLRSEFAQTALPAVIAISEDLYQQLIRRRTFGIDPEDFQPWQVTVKETRVDTWIYTPRDRHPAGDATGKPIAAVTSPAEPIPYRAVFDYRAAFAAKAFREPRG